MKNSKLMMGTAPFLVMLTFLFLTPAKASAELNNGQSNAPLLEIMQGNAESNTVSSDRKKKKKKKKKVHCEAFKN